MSALKALGIALLIIVLAALGAIVGGLVGAGIAAGYNIRVLALVALAALVGLAGCLGGEETTDSGPNDEKVQDDGRFDDVDRFIDREAGVVCYKFTGFEKGALSCVPLNQTNLDGGEP